MNNHLAMAETANDEQLLDQLVQDLFLQHLRDELGKQNQSLSENREEVLSLGMKFDKKFKNLIGSVEDVASKLEEQGIEQSNGKEDTLVSLSSLRDSLVKSSETVTGQSLAFKVQLDNIQEQLSLQDSELKEQISEQADHQAHQVSDVLAALQTVQMTLTEQQRLMNQQQLALHSNRRWGMLAVGFTVLNTLILAGMTALYFIKQGF
ncbi:hypothetical protein JTF19_03235 [Enterobacteriaceae bacterium RIT814]|uniref:hypothetical protein n=1 Tax=Leclercia pneumoniae TaxID=2815358 RepID=UPI002DBA8ABA|nr:hypothetical protein [Leclercia pneumoniae]MBM6605173.1 hypothetical protein [Enterobacteriaceae bacterium RIT 814]MEB7499615.1 hypothetical protein [Leclercia pneumoniae]